MEKAYCTVHFMSNMITDSTTKRTDVEMSFDFYL